MRNPAISFDRLFRSGRLQRPGDRIPDLRAHRAVRLSQRLDDDEIRGRAEGGGNATALAPPHQKEQRSLDSRLGTARRFGFRRGGGHCAPDQRQRAIVKLHYFGHSGGGAAALAVHARYVDREAAREERTRDEGGGRELDSHAGYLSNDNARGRFYDALGDDVDGRARLAVWAREDRRHFRIVLSAENGSELGDLRSYTREVMERAERILGARLEWVAIDHHDTANPHTHIVLRGRHINRRPLILPRDFVRHGFREIAREVATERLGKRTPLQARRALEREARAHRPTGLDRTLAAALAADKTLRVAALGGHHSGDMKRALRLRVRELQRLGLAAEVRRGIVLFQADWRERLAAMELHLDIRKRLMRSQTAQRQRSPAKSPVHGRADF